MKYILLIDDDDISNFINVRKIKNASIAEKTDVCTSGIDALKFINERISKNENLPELILLDIRMPVMDGFGFLEELYKLPEEITSKLKVAMLTSSLEKDEVRRSYQYKCVIDFINKPLSEIRIKELMTKMAQ